MDNIITLPGRASKAAQSAVPKFSPKLSDDREELFALVVLDHYQRITHSVSMIRSLEGTDKAITMLLDVVADLQKQREPK